MYTRIKNGEKDEIVQDLEREGKGEEGENVNFASCINIKH